MNLRWMKSNNNQGGFTLIELLVVIAVIVILFSVILVAVDPARRIGQANDAVRQSDVRSILSAVIQYTVDNNGVYPSIDSADGTVEVLGTGGAGACSGDIGANCLDAGTADDCLDLSAELVDDYLAEMPRDPKSGTEAVTGYYINKLSNGRIEVGACAPEIAADIKVKR